MFNQGGYLLLQGCQLSQSVSLLQKHFQRLATLLKLL